MTFWYGLGFADISDMPMTAFTAYVQHLPARQAEMKLILSEVESLPNMKPSARASLMREWMKAAEIEPTVRKATPGILKLLGIGVRHVQ
jgi:hypothetical protein